VPAAAAAAAASAGAGSGGAAPAPGGVDPCTAVAAAMAAAMAGLPGAGAASAVSAVAAGPARCVPARCVPRGVESSSRLDRGGCPSVAAYSATHAAKSWSIPSNSPCSAKLVYAEHGADGHLSGCGAAGAAAAAAAAAAAGALLRLTGRSESVPTPRAHGETHDKTAAGSTQHVDKGQRLRRGCALWLQLGRRLGDGVRACAACSCHVPSILRVRSNRAGVSPSRSS
jgi:hypothetical protein